MSDLIQTFRGSVNRWECDENDHLNVRFYAHKMYQALQAGLVETGLVGSDEVDVTEQIRSMHMRYIAEARIAAPITGYFGVVSQSQDDVVAVTELRNTASNALMASYVFELNIHNAGVGGSSPPVATNSFSAQRAENVSLQALQSDSEFATQNRDSVPLEYVPKPCPTCVQRSHLLKQLTRLNLKVVTQRTDRIRVCVVARHV